MSPSRIAIVGRPNVGKSTLFNRLLGRRKAVVTNAVGVTRDSQIGEFTFCGNTYELVDTAGIVSGKSDALNRSVQLHTEEALRESAVFVLVCDVQVGLHPSDREVAQHLHRLGRPVIVAVNKCDVPRQANAGALEFFSLGFGDPIPISAEHDRGLRDLADAIATAAPTFNAEELSEAGPVRCALIGRPNVGKSSLVNAIVGFTRMVVSEIPGTTRDAIGFRVALGEEQFEVIDTAGLRRRTKITDATEHFSAAHSLDAMRDADVSILVLDSEDPGVEQELKLAARAEREGWPLLILINKSDLVSNAAALKERIRSTRGSMRFLPQIPIRAVSARTGHGVAAILPLALHLHHQSHARVGTGALNRLIQGLLDERSPPTIGRGSPLRLYYAAQVGVAPPSFAITCSAPDEVPVAYARFIANGIRRHFKIEVPFRIFWRERPGREKREERANQYRARERSRRRA